MLCPHPYIAETHHVREARAAWLALLRQQADEAARARCLAHRKRIERLRQLYEERRYILILIL